MKKHKKITAFILSLSLGAGLVFSAAEKISAVDWYAWNFELKDAGIRGDANYDEKLTCEDLIRFQERFLGKAKYGIEPYVYDVNSDGVINIIDVITLKSAILGETRIWSYNNLPVMDGSTSAIPLEAGMKSELLGIPYITAKRNVNHHKTHESFQMLLDGDIDMIFTVPISESQQKAADEAGVHLNQIPVAKEGFVFVVNKNNPVDSLTQQQIKDIYSGKITNWSEVGGNDEPIIPYQRNEDSGSQNYMIDFMKDSELVYPPVTYRIVSMGALMDAVAVYDNSVQSIGYSVYSYAAQMYENSSSVKLIAVDGVKPSRETMADGTYPLLSNTYIMYTDDVSEDTLEFTDWAVSEEGQKCVLENGYIPVKTMEYPDRLKPFDSIGTGKEKPADYTPSEKYSYYEKTLTGYGKMIECLKDKELESRINEDIKKGLGDSPAAKTVILKAVNGYMSIEIRKTKTSYDTYANGLVTSYTDVVTLNYNLRTGEKIEKLSDYFYKGTDFADLINNQAGTKLTRDMEILMKSDFIGLSGEIKNFTHEVVYSGENSYFIEDNFAFDYSSYYLPDYMITGEYYDMKDLFTDSADVTDKFYDEWNWDYTALGNSSFVYMIEGSRYHDKEELAERKKISGKIISSMKTILTEADIDYGKYKMGEPYNNYVSKDLNIYTCHELMRYENSSYVYENYMFDPETGERIFASDIFGKNAERFDDKFFKVSSILIDDGKAEVEFYWNGLRITDVFDVTELNVKYFDPIITTQRISPASIGGGVYSPVQ